MNKMFKLTVLALTLLAMNVSYASNQQTDKNKEVIVTLYKVKNFKEASPYLSSSYIEHDPTAKPGLEGFKYYLDARATNYPDYKVEIKRMIAEGDIVAVYAHETLKTGDKGNALVDIYKLKNGKIVEHWDVVQSIPQTSENSLGMF